MTTSVQQSRRLTLRQRSPRELRQRASALLRLVERGETVEITDRGRPVALLGPIPEAPLERMRAAGELDPATEDPDVPEPLVLAVDIEAPSSVLRWLRRDER